MKVLKLFSIVWTLLCVIAGFTAAQQVLDLRSSTAALDHAGVALERTGAVLDDLEDLPVIGGKVGEAAAGVGDEGERARAAAEEARRKILIVAILLGIAISVLPTVPLLAVVHVLDELHAERLE